MSGPPERVSVAEQAAASGASARNTDGVDELRAHCKQFIDTLPGDPKGHHISQARSKLDEMIFWLRAHILRAARE